MAVPADVSSVRLVGFATTDLEELSRMNPTPQMVRLDPVHLASAATYFGVSLSGSVAWEKND